MGGGSQTVYHIKVSGNMGTIVEKTPVHASTYPLLNYVIDGGTLIAAYGGKPRKRTAPYKVAFYDYPKGGGPTAFFDPMGRGNDLNGVAISVADDAKTL